MKTIETTPEIDRFNRAVEAADAATDYRFDQQDALTLAWSLRLGQPYNHHKFELAAELELAAMDLDTETREVPAACMINPEDIQD